MSSGWSQHDKAVAKSAVARARRRAEDEAIALHARYKVNSIGDLWALEQLIRQWRKEREGCGILNYQTADEQFAKWLARGWLHHSDLANLSPDRLAAIKAKVLSGTGRW